ncbi:MAG: type II toxin-antitoxin system MqsA family antitoxin [Deltaproteobacteria bacterium]|nr:type II toxin-antitoxin system MqsA family antitoxin [Deltaproteobacteria bacterium]
MTGFPVCPSCKQATLVPTRTAQSVRAPDGGVLNYEDELTTCSTCGEAFYTPEQSLASSRARAAVLRTHAGLLSPLEIREIRAAYGLSQAQLEKALGLGAKTVVRWERGSVCQSKAVDNLLLIARDFPGVFEAVARRNGVEAVHRSEGAGTEVRQSLIHDFSKSSSKIFTMVVHVGASVRRKQYGRFRLIAKSTSGKTTSTAHSGTKRSTGSAPDDCAIEVA